MTKKVFSWLSILIVFSFALQSCVHDEINTASDPSSKEYTNKSLWKEDEVYIKNVKKVFNEYADKSYFETNFGEVYWDYATTMRTYDESLLEVPVIKNSKINFMLLVYREGNKIFFKRKEDENSKEFFKVLIFTDRKKNKLTGSSLENNKNSAICIVTQLTATWTNDDGTPGPTYVITKTDCYSTGPTLPCQSLDTDSTCGPSSGGGAYGGDDGGGYPYPQPPPNPCEKLKVQTTNTTFKNNITSLEGKTGDGYESGYRLNLPTSSGSTNQILQNKPGTQDVDITFFPNTYGAMHSHYDGIYPIFSPGDLILFNQWVNLVYNNNQITNPNVPIPPLSDIYYTVVTSNGNYTLTFDGSIIPNQLPTYTTQQFDDLNTLYKKMLDNAVTIGNVSGNITYDMQKLEKEFLKFVEKQMNIPGVKLYRTESTGNTELKLENGSLTTTQCP